MRVSPVDCFITKRRCSPRALLACASIALAALSTGCQAPSAHLLELYAHQQPRATSVRAGEQWAAAERIAGQHECDFVLTGCGTSMQPAFVPGSAVVVHPTSYFLLRPGMPVVYSRADGEQVAHVLVEKLPRGWVVAGLNNPEPDDQLVTPKNFVGVITHVFSADGRAEVLSALPPLASSRVVAR